MNGLVYYVEINALCMVILLIVLYQLRHKFEQLSSARIAFVRLVWATVLLCLADMISGSLRGQRFFGVRALLEASNLLYFEMLVVIGYLWMRYVDIRLGADERESRRAALLGAAPLAAFSLVALANHFTGWLFTFDDANLYHRGAGVVFHWVVNWFYLIFPTLRIARAIAREKNKLRRRQLTPLMSFIIAPIVASVLQMLFYGVSSSQAGITISLIVIFLSSIGEQVLTDMLTGLNNRRALNHYLEELLGRRSGAESFVLMLDLDNFKQINDRFGHIAGDRALQEAAGLLKRICQETRGRLFLCRYGGDEFLITGGGYDAREVEALQARVTRTLEEWNRAIGRPYRLSFSFGAARGLCASPGDAENLLRAADAAMYEAKALGKRSAGADGAQIE